MVTLTTRTAIFLMEPIIYPKNIKMSSEKLSEPGIFAFSKVDFVHWYSQISLMDHRINNGSLRLLVQISDSPILHCSLSRPLSDNGSIHLLVQILMGKIAKPFNGFDCN